MVKNPLQLAFIALHYWSLAGEAPYNAGQGSKT